MHEIPIQVDPKTVFEAWTTPECGLRSRAMTKATEDGWRRHEAEQRRAWMKLTPAQRLAWLEEAKRFAQLAKRSRQVTEEERQTER